MSSVAWEMGRIVVAANQIRCSIVMPAFNEVEILERTLSQMIESVKVDFECLVVVDSEDDLSCSVVNKFHRDHSNISLIINSISKGPAGAMKSGIEVALGEVVVIVSADGSDDASQIDELVKLVERGVTIAAASRYMHGGRLVNSPFLKGLFSRLAGLSLHYIKRIGTRDATNNFKAYSKGFLNSISIESAFGFEVGLELTVKASRSKLPIAEIPTIWIERDFGTSNFKLWSALPRYLRWYFYGLGFGSQ